MHRFVSFTTYPARMIFWLSTALLIATGSGHFYASDEEKMFATTLRMWDAFRAVFDPSVVAERPILSVYGPMQSLIALLTLPMGALLSAVGPTEMNAWLVRIPATWGNAAIVAAVGTLLGWLVSQRMQRPSIGAAVALTYIVGTPALSYASSFFSEPDASLWLLCAALPVLVASDTRLSPRSIVLSGFACLPAILAKVAVAPAVAVIAVCVGLSCLQRCDWHTILRWGAGATAALVVFLVYNLLARGGLLSSGYNANQSSFAFDWGMIGTGMLGQFFSPGKSIFLYAPLLLLWPIGIVLLRRDLRWSLAPLAISGAVILIHTNVVFWHGDGAWGPRYLLLCLPFMVLPLGAVYAWLADQPRRIRWAVCGPLIVLTLLVQIAGRGINLNAYIIDSRDEQTRFYTPAASPILGHWRMLVAQLARDWQIATAPGVTLDGFVYSEGDRTAGAQFPRFSAPTAHITIRPAADAPRVLRTSIHTCLAPEQATPVNISIDGQLLGTVASCPPRSIALLLRTGPQRVTLQTTGVQVADLPQHDWYPRLGVLVQQLTVTADGVAMPVLANPTPPSQMPAGPNAMRIWASDSRTGFYDVWWSYLSVPASAPVWPVQMVIWAIVVLIAGGAWWPRRQSA